VDVRIDNDLIRLLERLADEPLEGEQTLDPALQEIATIQTPTGFALRMRYSNLHFLLVEGLAGAKQFGLVQRLEAMVRQNPSVGVRAAALVALGYNKDPRNIPLLQQTLREDNLTMRFAAVEALEALGDPAVRPLLAAVAQGDRSQALRVYAAQALRRVGDPYGRQLLLQFTDSSNWALRAMAVRYLGELGEAEDYNRILMKLNNETNDFALAEESLALLRLSR
jgi:HEAT repeat protein